MRAGPSSTADDLRDRLEAALGPGYAVDGELGAGGMARVFAATRAADGLRVAVKALAPAVAACCDADRFRREMAVVARLDHPHIVPLVEECEACGGDRPFYFVMPLVAGESLRARLDREGAFPITEALRVLGQVASALAYAHDRGVVHRDIKPANVLLADGRALVADFGVAKAVSQPVAAGPPGGGHPDGRAGPGQADVARGGACGRGAAGPPSPPWGRESNASAHAPTLPHALTGAGTVVGTPAYMAPEQAAGDPDADHRADLYALGVLAYEMLAGAPPFGDRPPRALLAAHLVEAPAPLAGRRSGVPPALEALVMSLLAKDPAARPASAATVRAALDRAGALGA